MSDLSQQRSTIPPKKLYTYIMRQKQLAEDANEGQSDGIDSSGAVPSPESQKESAANSEADYPVKPDTSSFVSPNPYYRRSPSGGGKVMPADYGRGPYPDVSEAESLVDSTEGHVMHGAAAAAARQQRSYSFSASHTAAPTTPSSYHHHSPQYPSPCGADDPYAYHHSPAKPPVMAGQEDVDSSGYPTLKRASDSFSKYLGPGGGGDLSPGSAVPTQDSPGAHYGHIPSPSNYPNITSSGGDYFRKPLGYDHPGGPGYPHHAQRRLSYSEIQEQIRQTSMLPPSPQHRLTVDLSPHDTMQCHPDSTMSPGHSTISPNMISPRQKLPGKDTAYFDQMYAHRSPEGILPGIIGDGGGGGLHLQELNDRDKKQLLESMGKGAKKRHSSTEVSTTTGGSTSHVKKDSGEVHICQVCSDTAAGFHCGAFVCEACKKFFVRSKKPGVSEKFSCTRNKDCLITKETRTQCQYCRYHKCMNLGMYKPGCGPGGQTMNTDISSIPCKVCGAKSSGYHFGAITCEGCKGFFRRTVRERDGLRYSCSKRGNCEITTENRNVCKACRFAKCLAIGMTPEGSRIGRQPNAVKHATMLELQQIQAKKNQEKTAADQQQSPPAADSQPHASPLAGGLPGSASPGAFAAARPRGTSTDSQEMAVVVKEEPPTDHEESAAASFHRSGTHVPASSGDTDASPLDGEKQDETEAIEEDLEIESCPTIDEAALDIDLSPGVLEALSTEDDGIIRSPYIMDPPEHVPSTAEKCADLLEDVKGKIIHEIYLKGELGDEENESSHKSKGKMMPDEPQEPKKEKEEMEAPYETHQFTEAQIQQPLKQLYGQIVQMDRPHPYGMPGKFDPGAGGKGMGGGFGPMKGPMPPGFPPGGPMKGMPPMPPGMMPPGMMPPGMMPPGMMPPSGMPPGMPPGMMPDIARLETNLTLSPQIGKLSVSDSPPYTKPREEEDGADGGDSAMKTSTDRDRPPSPWDGEDDDDGPKFDVKSTADAILAAVTELEDVRKRPEGLNINDDQPLEEMWRDLMKTFIGCAIPVLAFCKKIPGFRKVDMARRIGLIQGSMYPLVLLVYSLDYDVERDDYAYFKFTIEEQKCIQRKFKSMELIEKHLWAFGRSLKTLALDKLEVGLLAALFIYRDIDDDDIKEELLATLEAHCANKDGPNSVRASVILTKLSELQRANLQHQQMIVEVMSKTPDLEITQLYEEVFLNAAD